MMERDDLPVERKAPRCRALGNRIRGAGRSAPRARYSSTRTGGKPVTGTSVESSRRVLQAVMRVICESEQWETGGYFRLEGATGASRLVVGWSGPGMKSDTTDYYKERLDTVVPAGGMISRVATSGKPIDHSETYRQEAVLRT